MALWLAAVLGVTLAASRVFCGLILALARRRGFVDAPGERKTQAAPVPLGGGLGIFLAIAAVAGVSSLAGPLLSGALSWHLPPEAAATLSRIAQGSRARLGDLALLLACTGGMALVGLADDARPMGPRVKLLAQGILATALYAFMGGEPFRITLFTGASPLWFAFTVLWVVTITNAFNFIDNMDGSCAVISACVSLLFLVLAVQTGQFLIAALFAAAAGAVLGFLPLNLPPARMYLGDAGSLSLGFLIASLTVLFTFYEARESPWVIVAPFLVLAFPLFDMATVLAIRLAAGRPLMVGDRNHFSHRLLAMGMSPRRTLACIGSLTVAIGLTATTLYALPPFAAGLALAQAAGILAVVWLLERSGRPLR